MRCFISIDIDTGLRGKISEIQDEIKKLDADVKVVGNENLHFTINFLGDVKKSEVDIIKKSLNFVNEEQEFKIKICGLGYFGSENHIRTLWLGVKDGENKLINIMKRVNQSVNTGNACSIPHLTIGRIKTSGNHDILVSFIKNNADVNVGEMNVKYVKLKLSDLTKNGPIYSDLHIVKLKSYE